MNSHFGSDVCISSPYTSYNASKITHWKHGKWWVVKPTIVCKQTRYVSMHVYQEKTLYENYILQVCVIVFNNITIIKTTTLTVWKTDQVRN